MTTRIVMGALAMMVMSGCVAELGPDPHADSGVDSAPDATPCVLTVPGESFLGPACADLGHGKFMCRRDDNGLWDSIPPYSCVGQENTPAPHCYIYVYCTVPGADGGTDAT